MWRSHQVIYNKRPIIKETDMSEDMQRYAVSAAENGMNQYVIQKDIAAHIKKEFDEHFGPTWHCVVGQRYGR